MILNKDYNDMLCALSGEGAKFLLVGAYAMAAHGYVRATGDMDIWIMPSPGNAKAVLRSLQRFGAPLGNVNEDDLQKDDLVFQIGVIPRRIDIITSATGLKFDDVYANSTVLDIGGVSVHVPSIDDMIRNKRATGRTKDLADAEAMERLRGGQARESR